MTGIPYIFDIHILTFIISLFMFFSFRRLDSNTKGYVFVRASFLLLSLFILNDLFLTIDETGLFSFDYNISYYAYASYLLFPDLISWTFYKYMGSAVNKPPRTVRILIHISFFLEIMSFIIIVGAKDTTFFAYEIPGQPGLVRSTFYYICILFTMLPYFMLMGYSVFFFISKKNYAIREVVIPIIVYSSICLGFGFAELIVNESSSFSILGMTLSEVFLYTHSIVLTINNDELTGLLNRRQMLKDTDKYIKSGTPWSLIMIDANNFKSINDEYGHSEGDRALKVISTVLDRVVDKVDSNAYRYAGDEFVILLSKESSTRALEIIGRIDNSLEEYNAKEDLPYILSVSAGFEVFDENKHASVQDVLLRADEEMYRIKDLKKLPTE